MPCWRHPVTSAELLLAPARASRAAFAVLSQACHNGSPATDAARCAQALPLPYVLPAPRQLTSAHAQVQAEALRGLSHGDIQAALLMALSKASNIEAPVFFAKNTDLFQNYISPIQFGFSGVSVSPCAVLISPLGVGFFPAVCQSALSKIATMSRGQCLHVLGAASKLCMSIGISRSC